MASANWRTTSGLKEDLLAQGRRFSFIQVQRLLRYWMANRLGKRPDEEACSRTIRVRPDLTLDFPETDITEIEEHPGALPQFLITATFLGLYGVSSPLPTFYTEDLMDEASRDMSVSRDFLDLINAPFYPLFYQCWAKYRQYVRVIEQRDQAYMERLFCMLGPGTEALRKEIPGAYSLLRYTGLFTQFPRSALGLKTLLSDALNAPELDILQCVPRTAVIPEDQRCHLGVSSNALGSDAYVGKEIADRMGAFRIRIGPVDSDAFHALLPGSEPFQDLIMLVNLYLDQPLEWDVEVSLKADEVRTACLGGERWSRLGWNTWIFSDGSAPEQAAARFNVQFPM